MRQRGRLSRGEGCVAGLGAAAPLCRLTRGLGGDSLRECGHIIVQVLLSRRRAEAETCQTLGDEEDVNKLLEVLQ